MHNTAAAPCRPLVTAVQSIERIGKRAAEITSRKRLPASVHGGAVLTADTSQAQHIWQREQGDNGNSEVPWHAAHAQSPASVRSPVLKPRRHAAAEHRIHKHARLGARCQRTHDVSLRQAQRQGAGGVAHAGIRPPARASRQLTRELRRQTRS
jgi:hypothetical protein